MFSLCSTDASPAAAHVEFRNPPLRKVPPSAEGEWIRPDRSGTFGCFQTFRVAFDPPNPPRDGERDQPAKPDGEGAALSPIGGLCSLIPDLPAAFDPITP